MTPAQLGPASLVRDNETHELVATVALIRSKVLPVHRLSPLIDHLGSAVQLLQLTDDDRLAAEQNAIGEVVGAVSGEDILKAARDVSRWQAAGMDIRTVLHPEYAESLRTIFNRPPLLFVQGQWTEAYFSRSVAVVGTRKPSEFGRKRAGRMTGDLVDAGFTIVSGLAAGIDTVAHTTALDRGGRTGAVIGTGILKQFPKENAALRDRILDAGGGILSQFFPDQPPATWTFPMRNVVMSGLTLATVVIEAGETSGARMQARVALQHGRTVYLLSSLVETHEWARKYVTEGAYGTRALEVGASDDIIRRLEGTSLEPLPAFA